MNITGKSQMTDIEIAEATGAEISLVKDIRKDLFFTL